MKTTVEALKDYYVEIGGTATDVENVTTIPDMINAITAMGGGSSLPEVTAEDNGDVLMVVDGAWNKATPNADIVVINTNSANEYPDGVTNSTVVNLINNGNEVIIADKDNARHRLSVIQGGSNYLFVSTGYTALTGKAWISYFSISDDTGTTIKPTVTILATS
jgi:hypothetical protein